MTLKAVDPRHFYLDDTLVDLVWIAYQAKKQTTAANNHRIKRTLNWLNDLAVRLLVKEPFPYDEVMARRSLAALQRRWYFDDHD